MSGRVESSRSEDSVPGEVEEKRNKASASGDGPRERSKEIFAMCGNETTRKKKSLSVLLTGRSFPEFQSET